MGFRPKQREERQVVVMAGLADGQGAEQFTELDRRPHSLRHAKLMGHPGQQGQQQPGFGQQLLLLQRLQSLGKPQDQLGIAVALGVLVSLEDGLVEGFKLGLRFGSFPAGDGPSYLGRP